jgi:hypothetical protein
MQGRRPDCAINRCYMCGQVQGGERQSSLCAVGVIFYKQWHSSWRMIEGKRSEAEASVARLRVFSYLILGSVQQTGRLYREADGLIRLAECRQNPTAFATAHFHCRGLTR